MLKRTVFILLTALLAACDITKDEQDAALSNKQIAKLLPSHVANKDSWAADMAQIFDQLKLPKTTQNICTAVAVIDQESNFHADPAVPNLGTASLKAIDEKLEEKFGKTLAKTFRNMLETKPTKDNSFIKQIKKVKTERELDELYQEIFDYFTSTYKVSGLAHITKLTGAGIDERVNPITTLGSMQVHIDYARAHRRTNMSDRALRADLYSQYGGLYYGIHRLMMYKADYDKPLYRFADYNSGMYSSRNAAFQQRVSSLTGEKLAIDGDLLLYNDGSPLTKKSRSESALIKLLATAPTPVSERQIRADLKKEKSRDFEATQTYRAVSELFKKKYKKDPAYAIMPQVVISGPKLSRDYDTNWFATRVDKRYQTCMATAKKRKIK
ncbi:DUF1615 domain-containing protein [Moraxella nasibovis]|uniref:DUF1615 domain-containing protein n=1 Tax=Moraxella nasibovis TaxID=2904120 RepID=UPI002410B001|nr:DUF1615 domain-containing protein [Moraxella nasibovis]WFF38772.1 DUF1615 domain-containing protein [Moraxella nasibovis]